MTGNTVRSDLVLTQSTMSALIHAPIDTVDIANWLLNLPDAEYQRCAPPDHKAAGFSTTDDGRPMSINVEMIGGDLLVQHYVAEVAERHHCHMESLSDVLTQQGWTTIQVTWDLSVHAVDERTCEYRNSVTGHPTVAFLDFIAAGGLTFDEVAAVRQAEVADHNGRETPRYAASLERKALAALAR